MKKLKPRAIIVGAIAALVILFIGFFGICIPLNIKSGGMWVLFIIAIFTAVILGRLSGVLPVADKCQRNTNIYNGA